MYQKPWAPSGWLWPRAGLRYQSGPAAALAKTAELREEFEQALRGIYGDRASLLRSRVRGADTPDELWHLRSEIFEQVSRAIGQAEADLRLRELDSMFEPLRGRARAGG